MHNFIHTCIRAFISTILHFLTIRQEFSEMLRTRLPFGSFATSLQELYAKQLLEAQQLIRRRRLEQWSCVAVLLWRFRSTLPFVALSSLLSMVLGGLVAPKTCKSHVGSPTLRRLEDFGRLQRLEIINSLVG